MLHPIWTCYRARYLFLGMLKVIYVRRLSVASQPINDLITLVGDF